MTHVKLQMLSKTIHSLGPSTNDKVAPAKEFTFNQIIGRPFWQKVIGLSRKVTSRSRSRKRTSSVLTLGRLS